MTPQKATLDRLRTLPWFVSHRSLSPKFQFSLSAVTLGIYFCASHALYIPEGEHFCHNWDSECRSLYQRLLPPISPPAPPLKNDIWWGVVWLTWKLPHPRLSLRWSSQWSLGGRCCPFFRYSLGKSAKKRVHMYIFLAFQKWSKMKKKIKDCYQEIVYYIFLW